MKRLLLLLLAALLLMVPVAAEEESYDMLYPHKNGIARGTRDLKWGLLDEGGKEVLSFQWDFLGELSEGFRLAKRGDVYGFLNEKNKLAIEPEFYQAGQFSEGFSCVKNEEGLWGYIDTAGDLVIPYQFEEANAFSCGLALVKTDGRYGFIDFDGKAVIQAVYEEAYPFYENLACVLLEGKYGYIDQSGSVVIPATFDLAFDFCEGRAVVKQGAYGLIASEGNFLIEPDFAHLSPQLKGGLLKAEINGKYAFVDATGKQKTKAEYFHLGDFSEGYALVQTENGFGYLNENFEMMIADEWDSASDFSEGYAVVSKDGLFGYINTDGTLATELKYTDCNRVSTGLGSVCVDGKWQFIKMSEQTASTSTPSPAPTTPPTATPLPEITPVSPAVSRKDMLRLQIGNHMMYQNGVALSLDVAPALLDGFTMLPIRKVIEAMGGEVNWNGEERAISVSYGQHAVLMHLDEPAAFVDGRVEILKKAPTIVDDRTLVPLRFAVESVGGEVEWVPETQEIIITY